MKKIKCLNRFKGVFVFSMIAMMFTSCSTSNYVVSTYAPKDKSDIAKYKTFAYMDFSKGLTLTPRMLSAALMAKSAINFEMRSRGFTLVESAKDADMLINLGTFTDTKQEEVTDLVPFYPNMYPMYWGPVDYYGWAGNVSYGTVSRLETYQEGVLLIDLVDAKNKVLLWHGSVSHVLQNSTDDATESNITDAVSALFQKFPVLLPK